MKAVGLHAVANVDQLKRAARHSSFELDQLTCANQICPPPPLLRWLGPVAFGSFSVSFRWVALTMSDVKQRKPSAKDSPAGPKPAKVNAHAKKDDRPPSSIFSVLFVIIFGVSFFFGLSWFFTNTWTFGVTMAHVRDPSLLMASVHDTLKRTGLPSFQHGETVAAEVDLSSGEVKNKWGDANKGTQEVAVHQTSRLKIFTPKELEQFNGEEGRPILLGVKGRVYDVTSGSSAMTFLVPIGDSPGIPFLLWYI